MNFKTVGELIILKVKSQKQGVSNKKISRKLSIFKTTAESIGLSECSGVHLLILRVSSRYPGPLSMSTLDLCKFM